MEDELESKGYRPVPPPAPSVQLAECVDKEDVFASEDGESEPFGPSAFGEESLPSRRRMKAASRSKDDGRNQAAASFGEDSERTSASSDRVLAFAIAALILLCGIVVAAVGVLSFSSTDAEDERAIDQKRSSSEDSAYDADAVVRTREANEAVTGQFALVAANESGELVPFVQRFIDDYDKGVDGGVSYGFAELGVTADELAAKLAEGLSVKVGEVDVYGSKAWVSVEVVSRSFLDQADVFSSSVAADATKFADAEEYKAYLKESMLAAFDKVEPRAHVVMIVVEQKEEGWVLSFDNIASILGSAWCA